MRKLKQITFLSFIFIITVAFNFQHNPPSNWYQQFLPDLSGATIRDIAFTDSLNGYAVTNIGSANSYILKTTNGGDNWIINYTHNQAFVRVEFINSTTGFTNAFTKIFKTTNAGLNWNAINLPGIFGDDMYVLNEDTIWLAMSESLTGGVFRSTNGGLNWQQQYSAGSQNPNKIYFINRNVGFISDGSSIATIKRTSNSGLNWTTVISKDNFTDMIFIDDMTGWRCAEDPARVKKSTDGGINWFDQFLPPEGGVLPFSRITKIAAINKDTLWGSGAMYNYGAGRVRGALYRTTDGGTSWAYQIPDTSMPGRYNFVKFTDKNKGWAYITNRGVHTKLGGDTTFLTDIKQTSTEIPKQFKLYQNYPNPFNPATVISFELQKSGTVSLKIYNLQGKEITNLVNEYKSAGSYTATFDANKFNLLSGVYFYTLEVSNLDNNFRDTKKMIYIA